MIRLSLLVGALLLVYRASDSLTDVPGNVVLGGGGGIALLAGFSGRFRYWAFLAVCSVAVAPVPILFFLATS